MIDNKKIKTTKNSSLKKTLKNISAFLKILLFTYKITNHSYFFASRKCTKCYTIFNNAITLVENYFKSTCILFDD